PIPRGQGLLPGLPPHPLPRRPERPGASLHPPSGKGDTERVDLLCVGERQPRAVLRQRQPHAPRPAGRVAALRGVLAWPDWLRPPVAVLRLQTGALRRAVAAQRAGDLVRHRPAAWRLSDAAPERTTDRRLAGGGD